LNFVQKRGESNMPTKKGTHEDLSLSSCCQSKCKRGYSLAQDYKSIYCCNCGKKQNWTKALF